MEQSKTAITARSKQARPRPSARPANARITDARSLSQMRKYAIHITRKHTMREWAQWTHHQKHGWWTHVIAAKWSEIRPTWRDYDDVLSVWRRVKDEERFDHAILAALDQVKVKQNELDNAVDELKQLVRRREKGQ
jgi:hypothetical protein